MFDDFASYFVHNVVAAYEAYRKVRLDPTTGSDQDLRSALVAATALYHMREHVPSAHRKRRASVSLSCPDYEILGDVVNAAKHKHLTRNDPLVSTASNLFEEVVVTEYHDDAGPYRHAEKQVTVRLNDGSTRDLFELLTNVINMWIWELRKSHLIPDIPVFQGLSDQVPPRTQPGEAARLDISVTPGLRLRQSVRLQRYNYDTGTRERVDLTGASPQMTTYVPSFDVEITLTNNQTGETLRRTVQLPEEESLQFAQLDTDAARADFLQDFAARRPDMFVDMIRSGDQQGTGKAPLSED